MTKKDAIGIIKGYKMFALGEHDWEDAFDMAIEALEKSSETQKALEKLKSTLVFHYAQRNTDEAIDNVSCRHCLSREKNECPLYEGYGCEQTPEEAVELFINYGMEETQ